MTSRIGRWLLPRPLVSSREEHVPHGLTGQDIAGSLARFLASVEVALRTLRKQIRIEWR
jgi:hypothetical protein